MHKEGVFIHPPHNSEIPQEIVRSISPEYKRIPEEKAGLLARWGVEQSPKSVQDALFSAYVLEKYAKITHQYAGHEEFLIRLSQDSQEPADISRLMGKYFDVSHYAIFDSSLKETEEERQLRRIEDLAYYFSQSLESFPLVNIHGMTAKDVEVLSSNQSPFIYYLCGMLCDTPYEQRARESLIAIWNEKFPPSLPDTESPKKVSRNSFFVRMMRGFFSYPSYSTTTHDTYRDIANGVPIQDCVVRLALYHIDSFSGPYKLMPLLAHPLTDDQKNLLLQRAHLLYEVGDSRGNGFFISPWLLWRPRAEATNYEQMQSFLAAPAPLHIVDFFNGEHTLEDFKEFYDSMSGNKPLLRDLSSLILVQLSIAVLRLPHRQLPQKYIHDIHVLRLVERAPLHQNLSETLQSYLSRLNLPIHLSDVLLAFFERNPFLHDARDKEALALFLCEIIKKVHGIKTEQTEQEDVIVQSLALFHEVCKKIREDIPYRIDKDDPTFGFSHSSKNRGLNCSGSAKLLSCVYEIIARNIPGFKERYPAQLQWFSDHVRIIVQDKGIFYAYDHGSRCIADPNILKKTPLSSLHQSFSQDFFHPQFDPQNPPPPFRRGPNPSYIPPGHTLLGQFMSPSERTPNITPPDFASHSQTLFAQSTEIVASALQYGVAVALEGLENAGLNPQLPKTPPSPSSSNSPSLRPSLRDPHSLHDHTPNIQESSSSLETSPAPSLSTTSQTLRRIAQGVGFILGTSAGYSVLSVLSRAPEGTAYVEAASLELTEVSAPEINMTIARNAFVLGADDVILNPDIVFVSHEQNTRVITLEGSQELTASPHLFSLLVSDNLSTLSSTHPTSPSFSDEKHISLHIHGDQLQALGVTAAFLESAVRDGYLDQHLSWQEIDLFINGVPTANAVRADQKIVIHVRSDYKKSLAPKRDPLTPEKYKSLRLAPLQTKSAQRKISKTAQTLFTSDR